MKKLSKLTEGVLCDMIKRASSKKVRTEDDIDIMGMDEFFNYISNRFESTRKNEKINPYIAPNKLSIWIPIVDIDNCNNVRCVFFMFYSDIIEKIYVTDKNMLDMLGDKFNYIPPKDPHDIIISITPKTGELTNSTAIEVITTILNNAKYPILKDKNKLTEGAICDLVKRSSSKAIRKEDGEIVKTCLGNEAIIKGYNCDYDNIIKELLNCDRYEIGHIEITKLIDLGLSREEINNLMNDLVPLKHIIYEGIHGTTLVAEFEDYDELLFNENECSKEDYISICKCISEKMRECGKYFELTNLRKYDNDYALCLIGENAVWNWVCENDCGDDYIEDFIDSFMEEFSEVDEKPITWSYNNYATSFGIYLNFNNLINFDKYKEFTNKWFEQ